MSYFTVINTVLLLWIIFRQAKQSRVIFDHHDKIYKAIGKGDKK